MMSKARKTEIRIAGFGGQGVVLAGVVLGRAAVLYDKNKAIQTQRSPMVRRPGVVGPDQRLLSRTIPSTILR